MTEAEWLRSEDPVEMLSHFECTIGERKLRLFSLACCRRTWSSVKEDRLARALDALERYADGTATDRQRIKAGKLSEAVRKACWDTVGKEEEVCIAAELWLAATKTMRRVARECGQRVAAAFAWADYSNYNDRLREERSNQAVLLREIFGNPFRPVAVDPAWRTSTVVALAQQMYDSRDFSVMPILADALQDAGCEHDDILNHCRDEKQPHVRGCWIVDLVLGKS